MQAKRKWLALVDNSTGSTYYVDEATGASQWEKPPELDGDQALSENRTVGLQQEEAPDTTKDEGVMPEGPSENGNEKRAVPANKDSSDKGDTVLLQPLVIEIGTGVKQSKEVEDEDFTHDDHDNASTSTSKPHLQRADSNSTMSTYGGELDSLAKYVTGNSTTLDRGAVVEVKVSKQEGNSGGNTSDIDEETSRSTYQETSGDTNRSTLESESESDEEGAPKRSSSVEHDSFVETKTLSLSDSVGSSSQDGILPGAEKKQVQLRETATDSSASSSIHSTSEIRGVDVAVDGVDRITAVSQFPKRGVGGIGVPIEQPSFRLKEDSSGRDEQWSRFSAKSGDTGEDTGTVSTPEGYDGTDNGMRQPSTSSPPIPTGEIEGAVQLSQETSSENSRAVSDKVSPQTVSDISSNDSHTMEPVEAAVDSGGGKESNPFATDAVTTQPRSSFDSVAVAAVALQRLQAGMLLRRQNVAIVKIQAKVRGWAARRVYTRLVERRETSRREELEAKQRAATAIQAVIRGWAARGKAQRARIQCELDSQRQQSKSPGGSPVEDTGTCHENTDDAVRRRNTKKLDDETDTPDAGRKQRAAAVIQAAARGRAAKARAEAQRERIQSVLDSQQQRDRLTGEMTGGNPVADTDRSYENTDGAGRWRDAENLVDDPFIPSAVGLPQSASNDRRDLNVLTETGVSQEASAQTAHDIRNSRRKEERHIQQLKEGIVHTTSDEWHHHDGMQNSGPEGEPQSREANLIFPDEDEHRDNSFVELGDYVNSGGGFLSGQLETIHEEEDQRDEHLRDGGGGDGEVGGDGEGGGGGGGEEYNAEKSSSGEMEPFGAQNTATTNPRHERSGLIENVNAAGDTPDGSDSSGGDFGEEWTDKIGEDSTDSDLSRYSNGRRTDGNLESTAARGGEEFSSDLTVSRDSDDDSGSMSEDGYFRRSSKQLATTSEEEEGVQQQRQAPPGMIPVDNDKISMDKCYVQDAVHTHHHDSPPEVDADETKHEGDELRASLEHGIEEENVGEGIYRDTTAPLERLEDLRSLVAAQAQASARVTMTAAGTDESRREAIRIRYVRSTQARHR